MSLKHIQEGESEKTLAHPNSEQSNRKVPQDIPCDPRRQVHGVDCEHDLATELTQPSTIVPVYPTTQHELRFDGAQSSKGRTQLGKLAKRAFSNGCIEIVPERHEHVWGAFGHVELPVLTIGYCDKKMSHLHLHAQA